jgi:tRNA-splicing ligase RtcB
MSERAKGYAGPLERLDAFRWRIPRDYQPCMSVDGVIYADEAMLPKLRADNAPQQVANVACLPGIVGVSIGLPDIHYGYGFPIGGVAAMDVDEGVVSPGGVGYDINCGVRLLRTDLEVAEVRPRLNDLIQAMYELVPAGVGSTGAIQAKDADLDGVAVEGAQWAVKKGFGSRDELELIEERGRLAGADPSGLSQEARRRGRDQVGTLGSGNHFLEVQVVEEIRDPAAAQAMGILNEGQITVMVHTGSRGFGHQICDDALTVMQRAVLKYGIQLPDRQLACAPVNSPEGQAYLAQMACAANYAWANRQAIAHRVREAFERVFGRGAEKLGVRMVYDVAHNIAKIEEHTVGGRTLRLCVHRKGATRAFAPGRPELPEAYRAIGQPVLVPGDMGRASYVLVGTERAMAETFGSACHGAGREMSRSAALRRASSGQVYAQLRQQGIVVKSTGKKTLAEEAPHAYKDVADVVNVCEGAGIARIVARMRPIGVVKG